jgi:hypothetical protein
MLGFSEKTLTRASAGTSAPGSGTRTGVTVASPAGRRLGRVPSGGRITKEAPCLA